MSYQFRYALTLPPAARLDGSGCVEHDIVVECLLEDAWQVVPARHKTVAVPCSEIAAALAKTTQSAKITAYKAALVANVDYPPVSVNGWDLASLEQLMTANLAAKEVAANANTFIVDTLGLSYPVGFTL